MILMYWKKKIRKSAERILDFRKENVCYATTRPASVAEAENIRSKKLRKKIYGIIWEEQLQRGVAAEISQALMEEVYTTPKPGLVDREDTGAHTDMNCQTFQKSTEAIAEDLAAMFVAGYSWEAAPETLFPLLRERGKKTEEKMFAATGGVNTHKGIIFTIDILATAARNFPEKFRNNRIGGCLPDQSGNDKKRVGTGSEKIKTKLGDHAWRKNLLPSGRKRCPGTGNDRISDSV